MAFQQVMRARFEQGVERDRPQVVGFMSGNPQDPTCCAVVVLAPNDVAR